MQTDHRKIAESLHITPLRPASEQVRHQLHVQPKPSRFLQHALDHVAVMRRRQNHLIHKSGTCQPRQAAHPPDHPVAHRQFVVEEPAYHAACFRMAFHFGGNPPPHRPGTDDKNIGENIPRSPSRLCTKPRPAIARPPPDQQSREVQHARRANLTARNSRSRQQPRRRAKNGGRPKRRLAQCPGLPAQIAAPGIQPFRIAEQCDQRRVQQSDSQHLVPNCARCRVLKCARVREDAAELNENRHHQQPVHGDEREVRRHRTQPIPRPEFFQRFRQQPGKKVFWRPSTWRRCQDLCCQRLKVSPNPHDRLFRPHAEGASRSRNQTRSPIGCLTLPRTRI